MKRYFKFLRNYDIEPFNGYTEYYMLDEYNILFYKENDRVYRSAGNLKKLLKIIDDGGAREIPPAEAVLMGLEL